MRLLPPRRAPKSFVGAAGQNTLPQRRTWARIRTRCPNGKRHQAAAARPRRKMPSDQWTEQETQLLKRAVRAVPSDLEKNDRWRQVAVLVGGGRGKRKGQTAVRRRTLKAHIRDSDVERKLTECVQKLLSFAELPANVDTAARELVLLSLLERPEIGIRAQAASGLGYAKAESGIPALTDLLVGDSESVPEKVQSGVSIRIDVTIASMG